jgi:hypothetical protein
MRRAATIGRSCRRFGAVLAAVVAVTCGATVQAADPATELTAQPVRDLHYGDVLFHYYQDDYFESIVRLEVSRDFGRLPNQAAEAELLAGGLYLSLGLHTEATKIFGRLLDGSVPVAIADRAHFYLARIGYQRGYFDEASQSLAQIKGALPGDLEAERKLLSANVLMAQGRYADAAASLRGWDDDSMASRYGLFNLGVALVRNGETVAGDGILADVGQRPAADEEARSLKDRANLALGYASLQQQAPGEAATALSRVRMDGPFTSRALLGLGWAESDARRPQNALVPWLELRGRKLLDASVQESYLAVPFAYSQLASNAEAANQYQAAVDAYVGEVRRIDESITAISRGGFLDAILDAAPDESQVGWFWELDQLPDAPHTRYLYHLLASHEFQEGLKNYRDLRIMRRNLARWQLSLAAFDDMIVLRQRATAEREPRKQQAMSNVDLDAAAARYDELTARVAAIDSERRIEGLASTAETAQLAALRSIDERLTRVPAGPQRDALAERARVLRGSVLWQLDADFKRRMADVQRELQATGHELDEAHRRVGMVAAASDQAPLHTAGFEARTAELRQRIARIEPRLDAAAVAQERVLADLAVAELRAQKRRLGSYASQAQFALAALYDHAASGGGR